MRKKEYTLECPECEKEYDTLCEKIGDGWHEPEELIPDEEMCPDCEEKA